MADAQTEDTSAAPKKGSKLPLIVGLVLFAAMGGGGFAAVRQGLILAPSKAEADAHGEIEVTPLPDIAFVPVDPLVINLGDSGGARFLRFQAQLEVNGPQSAEVARLMPRIVDVLNGYLRAVELADLQDRSALVRLRAQMLRRVQLVVGSGRVRDLLITEFVVN